jgi:hypothetical protein
MMRTFYTITLPPDIELPDADVAHALARTIGALLEAAAVKGEVAVVKVTSEINYVGSEAEA